MSIPANATEAPTIAKVWKQLKNSASSFTVIWLVIFITSAIDVAFSFALSGSLYPVVYQEIEDVYSGTEVDLEHFNTIAEGIVQIIVTFSSLPTTIIASLASVLITVIAVIYYATDQCPSPSEIFSILNRRLLRYVLAGFLFAIAGVIGLLFCIVPGILVMLAQPLYVYYVFTTDLSLITCLNKSFKGMLQNFCHFFIVSLLCGLAVVVSAVLCIFPVLAVYPMAELYMQNYIHHKGMVSTRSAPSAA